MDPNLFYIGMYGLISWLLIIIYRQKVSYFLKDMKQYVLFGII